MFMVLRSKLKNLSLMLPKSNRTSANRFSGFMSCKFPEVGCPCLLKKIVKQIAQEYGSYYLFRLDEHGLTAARFGTIAWQDIDDIRLSSEFPCSHGLTIKLKHPKRYLANIPPHEHKAFLSQPEFNLSSDWLPLPAKTLLQQIEQEYGSYYQLASPIKAA